MNRRFLILLLTVLLAWPLSGWGEDRADLYLKTADKMQARGYPEAALDYLDRAIEIRPDHVRALLSRGFLHLGRGEVDAALADFSRVIEIEPGEPAHYVTRGLALNQSGKREPAAGDFRKGCELGDQSACDLLHEMNR
ncbi:tetratricopeptide repeat protein [Geomesophilobacter sediminis]|uniref:Tetratricopeptide repeat protein n=1 Tax=Geomesophilobacter sediminis TaxID=2798584 RepID=A0A8J7M035_9BACT|nr:tetratricopeptide repeat protein [Geomesophilobacter sediminis]MBJ6723117.1 tetratricopeptide repeat protein [Geomesophilobacter sediminis]